MTTHARTRAGGLTRPAPAPRRCDKYYVPLADEAQQAFVPDWVFYASNDSVVAQAGALGGLRTPTALGVALAAALAALLVVA